MSSRQLLNITKHLLSGDIAMFLAGVSAAWLIYLWAHIELSECPCIITVHHSEISHNEVFKHVEGYRKDDHTYRFRDEFGFRHVVPISMTQIDAEGDK